MSNVTTRRFIVLSQGINTSDDVFNALLEVQDKETGEVGTLLCSHMCNWPTDLINQATWLEGCKTPEQFKDELRLALGFHPEQYTQWRVFKELNEIEIYLTGSWNQAAEEDTDDYQWYSINFQHNNRWYEKTSRTRRSSRENKRTKSLQTFKASLVRLCKRVLTADINQNSLNNFESLIHRLFNSGKINAWEACVLPSLLLSEENIHWNGSNDVFMPGLNPYLDRGIYSEESWSIPYTVDEHGIKVYASIPRAGFYAPCDFDVTYQGEMSPTVHYCNPNERITIEEE